MEGFVQKLLDNWDRKGVEHYFEVGGHGSGMMNRDYQSKACFREGFLYTGEKIAGLTQVCNKCYLFVLSELIDLRNMFIFWIPKFREQN